MFLYVILHGRQRWGLLTAAAKLSNETTRRAINNDFSNYVMHIFPGWNMDALIEKKQLCVMDVGD